jgi:hypothetical protein
MLHRSDIERHDGIEIATILTDAFEKFCAPVEEPWLSASRDPLLRKSVGLWRRAAARLDLVRNDPQLARTQDSPGNRCECLVFASDAIAIEFTQPPVSFVKLVNTHCPELNFARQQKQAVQSAWCKRPGRCKLHRRSPVENHAATTAAQIAGILFGRPGSFPTPSGLCRRNRPPALKANGYSTSAGLFLQVVEVDLK